MFAKIKTKNKFRVRADLIKKLNFLVRLYTLLSTRSNLPAIFNLYLFSSYNRTAKAIVTKRILAATNRLTKCMRSVLANSLDNLFS